MVGYPVTEENLLKPFKAFIESYKKMKETQPIERVSENEQSSNLEVYEESKKSP